MTDLTTIIAALTDAQKRAIVKASATPDGVSVDANPLKDGYMMEELEFFGITGERGWIDILTPLGLAVREELEKIDDQ